MAIRKVLILGAKGTLGAQLMRLYSGAEGWDREEVDVLDFAGLQAKIEALGSSPDAIINCVAFNDVDGAEDHPEKAFALNGEYVGKLANYAKARGVPLVHYSTNYVFDGVKGEYTEDDATSPVSVYGQSKLKGEQLVVESGAGYAVRTAVLFGPKGESELSKKSFVEIMLDLSTKRDTLQVVSDEVNSVTYAPDLAACTRDLLERMPPPGIYHGTNSGGASWYEFAKEIFRIAGRSVNVIPVPSTHFPRKAKRPAKAILLNTKLAGGSSVAGGAGGVSDERAGVVLAGRLTGGGADAGERRRGGCARGGEEVCRRAGAARSGGGGDAVYQRGGSTGFVRGVAQGTSGSGEGDDGEFGGDGREADDHGGVGAVCGCGGGASGRAV